MRQIILLGLVTLCALLSGAFALKCRSCDGRQCHFEGRWEMETCSDVREQECYTLTTPDGQGKTLQMGCTANSCRHLRDNREGVKCQKCDEENSCNSNFAIGYTAGNDDRGGVGGGGNAMGGSGGGGSGGGGNRGQGRRGGEGDGLGRGEGGGGGNGRGEGGGRGGGGGGNGGGRDRNDDYDEYDGDRNGGGGNRNGGGGGNRNGGGGGDRNVGGGGNRNGGTGGGGSSRNNGRWPYSEDHGTYREVTDTESVYRHGSDIAGSRYCYKCRGEQCRSKENMSRQLCKENRFETCYGVYDSRNGTTHEMGCTHYTCTLLRAYVDTNVCEKCTGDMCNHKLWKQREGRRNNQFDDYF